MAPSARSAISQLAPVTHNASVDLSASVSSNAAPERSARDHLASFASFAERAWRWTQLTHKEGESHPIEEALSTPLRTAFALAFVFAALAFVGTTSGALLAGTEAFIAPSHVPLLLAGLFVMAVLARGTERSTRRWIFLVGSLLAATYYSPAFAAASVVYFTALYYLFVSSAHRGFKLAFVALTFAALFAVRLHHATGQSHTISLFLCGFVLNYSFRIFYFLHEMNATKFAKRPRYVDVLLYFLLAPFFIILPSITFIPRFGKFAADLDKPMQNGERSAVRYAIAAAAGAVVVIAAKRLGDPRSAYEAAVNAHHWAAAVALGVFADPIWRVVRLVGPAYALTAMWNVLGFTTAPPIDRPLASVSFLDWWRRWNVHFREFLVDIFFYPLVLRSKKPYQAIVLGCVGVFLVGSVGAHVLIHGFLREAYTGVSFPPVFAESLVTAVMVVTALCLEKRRLRKRTPKEPKLSLSDRSVPVAAWAAARGKTLGAIAVTLTLVFGAMRVTPDLVYRYHDYRSAHAAQSAAVAAHAGVDR